MSKLKKLFGAGDQQDDEIMYGAEPKKKSEDDASQRIDSDPAVREQRDYGSAAAVPATEESKATTSEISPAKSEDSKSKGFLSKILPSKKDKADTEEPSDTRTAETAAIGTTAAGTTAAVATTEGSRSLTEETEDAKESKSKGLLSKILPSKSDKKSEEPTESSAVGGAATDTRATEPAVAQRSVAEPTADDSELRQGAVIAGAGAVGAAGLGAAAYEHHESTPQQSSVPGSSITEPNPRKDTGDDVSKATYTERSYQLASGSDPGDRTTSADDSHLGRDATIAGVGVGVIGAGTYAATRSNDEVTPDTRAQDIQNPEQVDTSSRFAPHVPGEFPTEDGRDPHAVTPGTESAPLIGDSGVGPGAAVAAATAAVGIGAGGAVSSAYGNESVDGYAPVQRSEHYYGRPPASPPATQTEFAKPAEQEHHYGRDAGLAGAATAVTGGGAYAATRSNDPVAENPNIAHPSTTSDSQQPIEGEHHYGRDAAVAGGAGTAGIAATEAWREQDSQSQQKESATSGPHQTDIANILDPRVKDTTPADTKPQEQNPDYGRDAAVIAAGTAMAGGGTYAATQEDQGSPKNNRVSTDDKGHHHLHKKNEERTGEKKPGFLSKLLHRDKSKKENEEPSQESQEFAGAGAARAIEGSNAGNNTTGLPVGEDGLITIVKEGSHPDDPHLHIGGDGKGVFQHKEEV